MIYSMTADSTKITAFSDNAVGQAGNDAAHSNMMPALCLNFIICLQGIYPERS
jgi:microcystin-dependent protein